MANIEQLVEQRCDEYRQRAAELEAQLSESEIELRQAEERIAILEREGQMATKSSTDLEPIRELIKAVVAWKPPEARQKGLIADLAWESLPALRSLLNEVLILRVADTAQTGIIEKLTAEVERLRKIEEGLSHD